MPSLTSWHDATWTLRLGWRGVTLGDGGRGACPCVRRRGPCLGGGWRGVRLYFSVSVRKALSSALKPIARVLLSAREGRLRRERGAFSAKGVAMAPMANP